MFGNIHFCREGLLHISTQFPTNFNTTSTIHGAQSHHSEDTHLEKNKYHIVNEKIWNELSYFGINTTPDSILLNMEQTSCPRSQLKVYAETLKGLCRLDNYSFTNWLDFLYHLGNRHDYYAYI